MVAGSRTATFRHRFGCKTLFPELLKSPPGGLLLGPFLGGSNPAGKWLGATSLRHSHFHQESLAVIGPTLRLEHVSRRSGLLGLQQLLQCRLVVSERDPMI